MIRVYINGETVFFRDTLELMYSLRNDYGIDLRNAVVEDAERVRDSLGEIEDRLDSLGYDNELEILEDLQQLINNHKRISKKDKAHIDDTIKKIKEGLDQHVLAYCNEVLDIVQDLQI